MTIAVSSDAISTAEPSTPVRNSYGQFSPDGREFSISNPRTPQPWANIIANPRYGLAVSQSGSGFTWIDNSQLAVITRWQQDFAQDTSGKFLYARDADSGLVWSLAPAPIWPAYDEFACVHGLGYTRFQTLLGGIRAEWTLFVDPAEPVEYWRVELHNLGRRSRRLELTAFLEWNCGVAPAPRREFHKLFLETEYDRLQGAIFAWNHMWEVPSAQWGHWNTPFPYISALASTEEPLSAQGDKAAFVGRNGDCRAPAALAQGAWTPVFGRHEDPIGALRLAVELPPEDRRGLGFVIATEMSRATLDGLLHRALRPGRMDAALAEVQAGWRQRLAAHRIETPEPALNHLVNDWARYQAISARLWGRCGYYQQSGAFGFRDQLQDSQVWLTIEPRRCREQVRLHAAHQFNDGSVYHWWHPLSEQGHVTRITDDLLWLAFVAGAYIRETGDLSILNDAVPFLDEAEPASLAEHVDRAFARAFARTSPRGLPYIGGGDWNDGLSACGLRECGESIWLGHFLAGLLRDWAEIHRRRGASARAGEFEQRRAALVAALNEHGWDGQWYCRATLDDGTRIGSHTNSFGRIYLNAQTWAVLNDVAPPERAAQCLAAVRRELVRDSGPLLLAPAYAQPDERIGYITRYAPGLRENGGVYTHAATWALAAFAKSRDAETVGRLLRAINPALKDPERYRAEPYVLPGNVDGPDSPHAGRAGWTWYTGAAQWLQRVVSEWVLGVRPEWAGLRLDPSLPPGWEQARLRRPWRGCMYEIQIERGPRAGSANRAEVTLDGQRLAGNLISPPATAGAVHEVGVICA